MGTGFRPQVRTVLLALATCAVAGWTLVVAWVAEDLLRMFHLAAPSSPEHERVVASVSALAVRIIAAAVAPWAVLVLCWIVAYARALRGRAPEGGR